MNEEYVDSSHDAVVYHGLTVTRLPQGARALSSFSRPGGSQSAIPPELPAIPFEAVPVSVLDELQVHRHRDRRASTSHSVPAVGSDTFH